MLPFPLLSISLAKSALGRAVRGSMAPRCDRAGPAVPEDQGRMLASLGQAALEESVKGLDIAMTFPN